MIEQHETNRNSDFDFNEFTRRWPAPVVVRDQAHLDRFSGGLLNARTLSNLDNKGLGPERIKIGQRVAYPVDSLVKWMKDRLSS